ncbi:CHAT domain-containing protein [Sinosporangium album]|uniref:CHAT domain-containing protein n=1 Tax=Sinosporangium album TaxID=504805 RepID=A0A1G7TE64_9ACTN|nr:CHAT domain-containing protein [Sinosporangium album]
MIADGHPLPGDGTEPHMGAVRPEARSGSRPPKPPESAGGCPHEGLMRVAEGLVPMAGVRPEVGWERGWEVLREGERRGCRRVQVVARRAVALATRELGDLAGADEHLCRAVELATSAGGGTGHGGPCAADLDRRAAQARLSLVAIRAERGLPEEALGIAEAAMPYLTQRERGKLGSNLAVALVRLGRCGDAVAACDGALETLSRAVADEVVFVAGALLNRGLALAMLHRYQEAERDIAHCARVAERAGLGHLVRLAQANLPFLAVSRGRIAAAFRACQVAERVLAGFPERLAAMRADVASALLDSGLPFEARMLLEQAVPSLASCGAGVALTDARLLLARAELLTGDPGRAEATASAVREEFAGQGRGRHVPLAEEIRLRARLAVAAPDPSLCREVSACADELAVHGWPAEGAELALVAAGLAAALGDRAAAEARLPPGGGDTHGVAMRAVLRGDVPGACAVLKEGVAEQRARVRDAAHPAEAARARAQAVRLAGYGLELALESGRPGEVLSWATASRVPEERPLAVDRLREVLGDAALVAFVRHGGVLAAVTVTPRRVALHRLGSAGVVAELAVRLRYAMRRAARRDGVAGREPERAAAAVQRRLLRPMAAELSGRELVVVPAGTLHTLPWAALPSLREVPVSVCAGVTEEWARGWARTGAGLRAGPRVAVVAGPGLAHARAEADAVVACHPGAVEVPPSKASVVAALAGADVVHVAAHGRFCPRAPLLSGVELADGSLSACELPAAAAARLVVLSACDAGMARSPEGGLRLGLVGALLAGGAACVVAGLLPVRDDESLALMAVFHEVLGRGRAPARALADAGAKAGLYSFACFGNGLQPVSTGLSGSVIQCDQDPM